MEFIAIAVMMAICVAVPAIAQGLIASKAMESIGRQPEAAGQIRSTLIIALSLVEALAIYGMLVAIILAGKI